MAVLTPPPRIHVTEVDGFAHCRDALCAGNAQEPVRAVVTLTEWTIASRGGKGVLANVVENSTEDVQFADAADSACSVCGKSREVVLKERPTYQRLSGFPQDGLIQLQQRGIQFDPNVRNTEADQAAAEAQAKSDARIAELEAKLDALLEAATPKESPVGRARAKAAQS